MSTLGATLPRCSLQSVTWERVNESLCKGSMEDIARLMEAKETNTNKYYDNLCLEPVSFPVGELCTHRVQFTYERDFLDPLVSAVSPSHPLQEWHTSSMIIDDSCTACNGRRNYASSTCTTSSCLQLLFIKPLPAAKDGYQGRDAISSDHDRENCFQPNHIRVEYDGYL